MWLPAGIVLTTLSVAFYSSLQHEIIHGHPFANQRLNDALVFPSLTIFIPYFRFRDTHLAHHLDSRLTDPYDDPETNYLDPIIWESLSSVSKAILRFNNTMLGRLLIGPILAQIVFMKNDWRDIRSGNKVIMMEWIWHIFGLVPVAIWFVAVGSMPIWAVLLSAYMGLSILKIRTFLEHQAHERSNGRTVVIEDKGPLAFMFLNNNLHVVHHMHPKAPWYMLPELYASNRDRYLKSNDGYRFRSYGEIFSKYLFKAKDPVSHPIWRRN